MHVKSKGWPVWSTEKSSCWFSEKMCQNKQYHSLNESHFTFHHMLGRVCQSPRKHTALRQLVGEGVLGKQQRSRVGMYQSSIHVNYITWKLDNRCHLLERLMFLMLWLIAVFCHLQNTQSIYPKQMFS